jgi:ubiquinone/menaquinone biosynthesis C-methylase UbiE
MLDQDDFVRNFYTTDEYIIKNPSLFEEDSPWKINKIIPLVDRFASCLDKVQINVLDVGGGTGLILSRISSYIEKRHNISVNKYALDLSPGALKMQSERNPDLKKILNEDIRMTSLDYKEIDLTLLIDVIEHVPNPVKALEEVRRISKYAIFKVPLEGHFIGTILNFIKRGEPRRQIIKTDGHINIYTYGRLRNQIQRYTGQILDSRFTNLNEYFLTSEYYKGSQSKKDKLLLIGATLVFKLSPRLAAFIFSDHAIFLVKCR